MKKLRTFLGWILLAVALILLCWGTALWNGWSIWGGLLLGFAIIDIWLVSAFAWRLFKAWRQRSRTAAPVEKLEPVATVESALKAKWHEGIQLLKRSGLKRLGNPLYVLPWYMVMGRCGSGKSTALMRMDSLSPLVTRAAPSGPLAPTANIDWWFFDKAIFLDTTGNYVAPQETEATRKEWRKVLDLLGHYRAKEGLNGLVITIEAQRLLNPDPEEFAQEGRAIRLRIEQLIRLFDQRFPIYILVTQCDLLYGIEAWSHLLPADTLKQAMGYINRSDKELLHKEDEFVEEVFSHVSSRLKILQLALLERLDKGDSAEMALLLFPQEFEKLKPGLKLFLRHAQAESPYLESALLRGIFFCSALQLGQGKSTILEDIALSEKNHEPTHKGLFLSDFAHRILPADRYRLCPAAITNPWRRATRHLGALIWVALSIVAGIYLSFSFIHNLNLLGTLQDYVYEGYPENKTLTQMLLSDTDELDKFKNLVNWIGDRDLTFLSRSLAFDNQVEEVELMIKKRYVHDFNKEILPKFDAALYETADAVLKQGDPKQIACYIQMLARSINLAQARLQGADYDTLKDMPPLVTHTLVGMVPKIAPETARYFNEMYVMFLAWAPPDLISLQRIDALQRKLSEVVLSTQDLAWVEPWLDAQPDLPGVGLNDFWPGSRYVAAPKISPMFTQEGKLRIDAFMSEINQSASGVFVFSTELGKFNETYATEKIKAWREFTENFSQGEKALVGSHEWRIAVAQLTTAESPYQRYLQRLTAEFKDEKFQLPAWIVLSRQLVETHMQASQQSALEYPAVVNDIGGKVLKDIGSGKLDQARSQWSTQFKAIPLYQAYSTALTKTVDEEVASAAKATQVAARFHLAESDPAAAPSALYDAYARLSDLKKELGSEQVDEQVAWSLLAGPLNLAARFADVQSSCTLQETWQSKVLWPLQSATALPEVLDQLYGQSGTVWAFTEGPAKPFLKHDDKVYQAV